MAQETFCIDCKICGSAMEVTRGEAEPVAFGSEEKYRADCLACGARNYYLETEVYRLYSSDAQGLMGLKS